MRPQGKDPSLGYEVGHRSLLIATGRNPQSLVLDHLKFVQVCKRHLREPDGSAIIEDGALDTVAGAWAEGEVGVHRDTQDFRGSVQRGHHVADWHLRGYPGLVGVRGEQSHAGFLGSNGQLSSICPLHQRRAELARPSFYLYDLGAEASNVKCRRRTSCQGWRWNNPTQSDGKASGAASEGTRPSCHEGMLQTI